MVTINVIYYIIFGHRQKKNNIQLCNRLNDIKKITKDDFLNYRSQILNDDIDDIEKAKIYFVINRTII